YRPQLEADLEGRFESEAALRQRLEEPQGLFEPATRILQCRSRGRLGAGLPEVARRPLAKLPADGVMGEALDLLAKAIPVNCLDRVHEQRVKLPSPFLQQAAVRDLVRERVLERVLGIR